MAGQLPPNLKAIQPFLKVAADYDKRDAVVAYFCRMYAVQKGIKLANTTESKTALFALMDQLEKTKKELTDVEAVTNDIVAHAYIENKAINLFLWADTEDRAARFGKNVVKAFYTSSLLFEVLTMFGELTEEVAKQQKYAKWKAAYIVKCQKAGQTPIPGPQDDGEGGDYAGDPASQAPGATGGEYIPPYPSTSQNTMPHLPTVPQPQQQPSPPVQPSPQTAPAAPSPSSSKGLSPTENEKAQKLCRYAISALQYDDYSTAVSNLEKALALVKTGQ